MREKKSNLEDSQKYRFFLVIRVNFIYLTVCMDPHTYDNFRMVDRKNLVLALLNSLLFKVWSLADSNLLIS